MIATSFGDVPTAIRWAIVVIEEVGPVDAVSRLHRKIGDCKFRWVCSIPDRYGIETGGRQVGPLAFPPIVTDIWRVLPVEPLAES